MRYLGPFILLLLSTAAISQDQAIIDSLKQELKHNDNKAEIYIRLAQNYLSISTEEVLKYSQKAYDEAVVQQDDGLIGEALYLQARVYLDRYEYDQCIEMADSAIIYFQKTHNISSEINCEVMKASISMLQSDYDKALALYEDAAQKSKAIDAMDVHASALINMGRIYRVRGEYAKALDIFQKVLEISEELDNAYLRAHALHFIGLVNQDQQYFDLAIEYYLRSLKIFEENNILQSLPFVLVDLGSSCREAKNYPESIRYFRQALGYFTKVNDRWGLYELNRNMGLSYMNMGRYDSAWICFENTLRYSRAINEKSGECHALNYMGEILILREDYQNALHYLQEALQLNEELNNKLFLTNILFNIGKCNLDMGNSETGLKILLRSLEIADSLDVLYEKMAINRVVSTAYKKLNRYREALEHYEIYSVLNDSIYKEESNRSFAEMERKYQSEKQKQEISQLRLDKVEQEVTIRKNRSMRNIFILGFLFATVIGILLYRSYLSRKKADQEKEALLKEIHHRVKNNLQIISSLLSIQTDNLTDSKVINAVQESQSRVKAMALIHQLLYQDKDLSKINFGTYLPQLVHAISSIFKKEGSRVNVDISAEDQLFDIDTAIPLGLIVAELTANAYKYAFNENMEGNLRIKVEQEPGNLFKLIVADNGPGLPEGMEIKNLNSMGLRLVNILTDQLDGSFGYLYEKGSVFTVQFNNSI